MLQSDNNPLEYLTTAQQILAQIQATQAGPIDRAARQMARSISEGGLVHMFGAGHSALPVAEAYPKCGNIVGFHPMIELALFYFTQVVGSNGIRQFTFLEQAEGYGEAILQSHILKPCDTMLVFSQSGINGVVMDIALGARRRGLPVVAVVSVAQSSRLAARHSSGQRLHEIADIVIDNCVPYGDVTVQVPGMDEPMGPASTLAAIAIVNTLIVETARCLVALGQPPIVNPTLNAPGGVQNAPQRMERALKEYRRRTQR
ncbi:MAG TPA: sugar isomerase domain-containing protein [Anaerolineales bacterium]